MSEDLVHKWNFRLAEPRDAEAFANWAAHNEQIEPRDLEAGMKKTNPTVLHFVAEKDGVPVVFAPLYLSAMLAHMGFNPNSRAADKLQALNVLQDGVMAFMVQFGIREIMTKSLPEYGMAKWATTHGFEMEERRLFVLDLNKEMATAEK
jgi:hypothetical protein